MSTVLVLLFLVAAPVEGAGPFPDLPDPALVAPGVVSTVQGEYSPTFDVSRGELVFMRRTPGEFDYTLTRAVFADGRWNEPEVLSISGVHRDAAPYFSPDGEVLFFDSRRPTRDLESGSINVWRALREGDGWTEPQLLRGPSKNPPSADAAGNDEFGPAVDRDGNLWVYSFQPPYRGGVRLVSTGPDYDAASVDPSIPDPSAPTFVSYLYIDPDGRFSVMEGRQPGRSDGDLFCSCREDDGSWGVPQPLEAVNTDFDEGGPWVTGPDGHLLFTSTRPAGDERSSSANLWSIPLGALGIGCLD